MKLKIRIVLLSGVVFLCLFGIGFRLFAIQILRHSKFTAVARRNYTINSGRNTIMRGSIIDRNGKELALNRHTYSVGFRPISDPGDRQNIIRAAASSLNMSEEQVRRAVKGRSRFTWLARHVSPEKVEDLFPYSNRGIELFRENHRYYPFSPIGVNVLGCVGTDNQGLSGIEFYYNELLTARVENKNKVRDARGRTIYSARDDNTEERPGNIVLSIDKNIQYILRRELLAGIKENEAGWAMAVVQDVNNGKILGMEVCPSYDSNAGSYTAADNLKNMVVSHVFEPGSTFKIVPAAAALEEKLMDVDEMIDCEGGTYDVGGFPIRDFNSHDELSFMDCMVHSSNIGMAKIGSLLGENLLYKYARDFGFGNFTGVRLPGETRGILRKPDRWSGTSLSRISFGQEIGVTAIQLIGAISAVANGGVLYEPRIVQAIEEKGRIKEMEPLKIRRVISEENSRKLRHILREAVERGSGERAAVGGYSVAGKTGTAQKFNLEKMSYEEDRFVALFGGFIPADEPEVAILVIFDEPGGELHWGGHVAAPVFSRVAKSLMSYLSIPPDRVVLSQKRGAE